MDFKWSNTLKSSDATVFNNGKAISIQGGWAVTEDNMINGKYYFEFIINKYTQIVIGVTQAIATATKPTEAQVRAMFGHDGNKVYPRSAYGTSYNASNTIGVAIDIDKGEISFTKDGVNLGVAFDNLKSLGELKLYVSTTTSGGSETLTIVDDINNMKHRDVAVKFLYNNRMTLKNHNTGKQFSVNNKKLIHLPDGSQDAILKYGIKQSTTEDLGAPFTSHLYPTTVINKMSTVSIGKSNSMSIKETAKPWTPLVVWHETKMTSNTTPTPLVASASSEFDSTLRAWNAFSDSTGNWCTVSGQALNSFITLDFGTTKVINCFSITPRTTAQLNQSPKIFELQTSTDGQNFTTTQAFTYTSWIASATVNFDLNSATSSRYFRILIKENMGNLSFTGIDKIRFGNKREVN